MKPGEKAREPRPIPVPRVARELLRRVEPKRMLRHTTPTRSFSLDGVQWIARIVGEGSVGTGTRAAAVLAAVHFCRADAPDHPVRQTLLPCGRLETLFEEELRDVFRAAQPVGPPDESRA